MLADAAATLSMNGIYRYQRYIYDASRRYFLLGRLHMISRLLPPPGGHILEVGCGTAWNLIRAAQAYPDAKLYGFDISTQMLQTAGRSLNRRGLRHRVSLACGDATGFDAARMFSRAQFDRVFVSYALSMIPHWPDVLAACAKSLDDKGELHIVDFGQCEGLPAAFRRVLFAWLAHFSVEPRAGLEQELVKFAAKQGLELEISRLYRDYAVHAVLRRH